MVRVVRLGDGSLVPGRTLPGRGAWLCRTAPTCADAAHKRRAFERALRGPVAVGAVDELKRMLGFSAGAPDPGGPASPAS
jgi:predicted RNA-binding protein YlxR (DUF448 family)